MQCVESAILKEIYSIVGKKAKETQDFIINLNTPTNRSYLLEQPSSMNLFKGKDSSSCF